MKKDTLQDTFSRTLGREVSRRGFVQTASAIGLATAIDAMLPGYARGAEISSRDPMLALHRGGRSAAAVRALRIGETPFSVAERRVRATTINGTVPGPLLRFREGEDAVIRVRNDLREDTSIHWHGIILPPDMDGVPGVSFPGIAPRQTFEYRFPLKQYGTYWYHSHSGFQEQLGHYGPLIIDPAGGYPYKFDREYVIVLSDWTFENPYKVLANLKKQGNYYNFQRRTVGDFFSDVRRYGLKSTIADREMWARMRMDPTDLSDVTGTTLTFLMNGLAPVSNWTGLFRPGERVLLRVINAAAATIFDFRAPGLPMSVVQVSGQFVQPVETDEFRISIAETYDVIVQPQSNQAYSLFAEAIDRSGYTSGTLAPRAGMVAPVPARRKRPVLTMADMGMDHGSMGGMDMPGMDMPGGNMPGMDHGNMPMPAAGAPAAAPAAAPVAPSGTTPTSGGMAGMDHANMPGMAGPAVTPAAGADEDAQRMAIAGATWTSGLRAPGTLSNTLEHEPSKHGPGNGAVPMMTKSRLSEAGSGLGTDGWRVLRYTDLRALKVRPDFRAPDREIEMHLTGNMERFMWSIDGQTFKGSDPIRFTYGERIRLTMVNDTMMNHPMHLHGMWMELENGHGSMIPRVHTVNVKPAERLSLLITADAPGRWAFHCHVLYHMEVGMFRVVEVSQPDGQPNPAGSHNG